MKNRHKKNAEKVVGDGVWLRREKSERKKGLNGKLPIDSSPPTYVFTLIFSFLFSTLIFRFFFI